MGSSGLKYYWIHPSCGPNFESYILESQALARRALQRLKSKTDTDFARVFNVIFKTPKNPNSKDAYPLPEDWFRLNRMSYADRICHEGLPIYDQITETLWDFSTNWERTDDRKKSHVRIYNENAARLVYNPADMSCVDPINHLNFTCHQDLDKSRAPTNERLQGFCVGEPGGWLGPKGANENPKRAIIDLFPCAWPPSHKWALLSMQNLKTWISKKAIPGYPSQLPVGEFGEPMLMKILAHEWMHSNSYGYTDGTSSQVAGAATSGWKHIMNESKEEAYKNAEAIALLIIAAGFADLRPHGETEGGFTLDRAWDKIPGDKDPKSGKPEGEDDIGNFKWDAGFPGNDAATGLFKFYKDITK